MQREERMCSALYLLFFLGGIALYAQEAPRDREKSLDLEPFVITATRYGRKLGFISKSVTVITDEEIEERNPMSVQSLLDNVPGVSFSRAGGLGGQVVVRGFNSDTPRTVLYIDGDRFRGRNTLEYNFLDPHQIERIEIIRGPVSSIYGSDAISGVVHVITRKATRLPTDPFRLKIRPRALNYNSSNNLRGTRIEVEGAGGRFDILLGNSFRKAGDFRAGDGKVKNSDFTAFQSDLRMGIMLAKNHRVELIGKFSLIESGRAGGLGGIPGAPFVQRREAPLRELFAKLSYKNKPQALGLDRIESSLYIRRLDTRFKIENRELSNGLTTKLTESKSHVIGPIIVGGKLFAVKPWGKIISTLGADFYHEDRIGSESESAVTTFKTDGSVESVKITPRAKNVPDSNQINIGLYMHHDWDPSPLWTLSAGGRMDWFRSKTETSPFIDPKLEEVYKNATPKTEIPLTGSLGAIYRPWQFLHFTTNIGKSFRVPVTVEMFASGRFGAGFFVPNPDLKSEEGMTYEIGARLRFNEFHANLTTFHSGYRNFIERRNITFLGLPSSQSQNTGKAEARGLEVDATWEPATTWKIFSNASYIHGTDTTNQRPLAYIPPLNGLVGARYTVEKIGGWVEVVNKWSLGKERIDETQERKTSGFSVFNLYAGKELGKLFRLHLGLENLLDTVYRMPTTAEDVRFPSSLTNPLAEPGRAVSVGLTSKF